MAAASRGRRPPVRDTCLPRSDVPDLPTGVSAVLLAAPRDAVVSHHTAAAVWGLAIPLQPDDPRIHVTVATGSAVRARADRNIHRGPLVAEEVVARLGFRLTTPQRAWRDLAATLPAGPARRDRPGARPLVHALRSWQQLYLRPSGRR